MAGFSMPARYLFGPVDARFADQFLARHRRCGDCLPFDVRPGNDLTIGPDDSWDDITKRLPEGWRPDFIALFLHYSRVPRCLETAPVPLVGLAGDPNLLWHYYRRRLPVCDLVLTDTTSARVLAKEGVQHVQLANLFGCERQYLETPADGQKRDIDILFIGNFHAAVQRERMAWLGRLAAFANRWNVVVTSKVYGDEYRALMARARIVFNRSIRSECNSRAVEAAASGALLFQEADNCEVPGYFEDRKEYIAYRDTDLEDLLLYYLEHEDERRVIAEAGQRRAQAYGFAEMWQKAVEGFVPQLPTLIRQPRYEEQTEASLLLRTWQSVQPAAAMDASLVSDLRLALSTRQASSALRHALAVALVREGMAKGSADYAAILQALRQVLHHDPTHLVASLNLAEVLAEMGQPGQAIEQARQTLALLERCPRLSRDVQDALHVPTDFDHFRVEWEQAAWNHAGEPAEEERAKRTLLRWRLHTVLAGLTGELADYYEAAAARPDLPTTQAALGCALARAKRYNEAVPCLQQAIRNDPFDLPAATALFEALGLVGAWPEQHQLAQHQGRMHKAAPGIVPARDWFIPPPERGGLVGPAADLGQVVWQGDFQSLHSLALVNRELCGRLVERGCPVVLRSSGSVSPDAPPLALPALLAEALDRPLDQPAAVHVRHLWPPDWVPPAEGHWVVIQPWEFGSLPRVWIDVLKSQVDEVWAYSAYVRDCYLRSGMPAERVHIVPLGVDVALLERQHPPFPLRTGKRFKFLFVGGTIHRKGIDVLLRVYAEVFTKSDDVCLVVKDSGNGSFYRGQTAEKLIAELQTETAPEIEYLTQDLSAEEMASLYQSCDCLVQPYRGEGFGLPIAEAMACGLPVIVTGHGAALDFCDESRAFLLPARLGYFNAKRIDDLETVDTPWLAEPDQAMLRYYLRYVMDRPDEARAKGDAAASFVRSYLTWDRAADAVLARLVALRGQPVRRLQVHAEISSKAGTARPRVSLAMIVRDEEASLEACLRSAADLVDEMIVVDTGSTDRTKEVAHRCGAKVFDFAWVNDFAAARNESIRHAAGQWILWLDADERLDETNRQRLREVLATLGEQNTGFLMRQYSRLEGSTHAAAQVDHVRLFPNRPDVRWQGRVHEQILVPLRRVGANVVRTDIVIDHRGYDDPARQGDKIDRNRRLLRLALAENPSDAFTLYNLATVVLPEGKLDEAMDYLRRSLANSDPHDPLLRKVHVLMTRVHQQRGNRQEALAACRAGRAVFPDEGELLFHEAVLLHEQKMLGGAEACLLELLRLEPGKHLTSVDAGLYGYRTRNFLGQIYREQGRTEEAEAQWQAAVAECPGLGPAWMSLALLYLAQSRWDDLERASNQLAKDPQLGADGVVNRGRAQLGRKEFAAAGESFAEAICLVPQAVLPRVLLSHALLQEGKDWPAAERALRDVLALEPGNAEAQNNLRLLLQIQGKDVNGAATTRKRRSQAVSLCMIVRNEEHNLPACLASIADVVDEIIVVDTGSTDATKAAALRHGAKVFDFPWIDHFAAARNESLRHATGQWAFWLDADDRVDEQNREILRQLFDGLRDDNACYIMKCHCLPDASGVSTVVDHVRLFRNRPDVRWSFRIHEQILPAVKASGGELRRCDVVIQHTGYQDPALRRRKLQRDLGILLLEKAEQPDHAFTLFNLGQVYKELRQTPEALAALTASLEHSAPADSIVRKLYALIAQCHVELGNLVAALDVCRAGRALCADDLEILFQEGCVLRHMGDLAGAVHCWEQCLRLPPGDYLASFNPGLRGHVTRHNLAQTYRDQGRSNDAEAQWRAALQERPYYEPAWRGLMELLLSQLRWPELEALAQEVEGGVHGAAHAACIRGRVLLSRREFDAARAAIQQTIERFPAMVEPRELLSYVFLQEGRDWQAAERALKDVLHLVPDHMEARRNLAVLYQQRGVVHGEQP
jgi:tetratricopeptide (TPR) repeat protein